MQFILSLFCLFLAKFSLAASESVVIVEVLASIPKPSCPTCPESRELRLVADGRETTEARGALHGGQDDLILSAIQAK